MTGPARTRRRVVVSGLVQGVFFRDSCRREARARGIAGWVRNNPDGTLEAVIEGDPRAVEDLVRWLHAGPPQARVSSVEVTDEVPEQLAAFRVR